MRFSRNQDLKIYVSLTNSITITDVISNPDTPQVNTKISYTLL